MKANDTIKCIMKTRGFSNQTLANKLGKSTASAVSNNIYRKNGMRIDTFTDMVEAMNCEVVIRSTSNDGLEWVIRHENEIDLDKLLSNI